MWHIGSTYLSSYISIICTLNCKTMWSVYLSIYLSIYLSTLNCVAMTPVSSPGTPRVNSDNRLDSIRNIQRVKIIYIYIVDRYRWMDRMMDRQIDGWIDKNRPIIIETDLNNGLNSPKKVLSTKYFCASLSWYQTFFFNSHFEITLKHCFDMKRKFCCFNIFHIIKKNHQKKNENPRSTN